MPICERAGLIPPLSAGRAARHNAPVSLVGIDVGSSAVKAAAYRAGGGLLAQAAEDMRSRHPAPGAAEVGGDDVWAGVVRAVRRLAASERVRRDPPVALAVSASGREGFPALADGSPLGPCLRTADARRPATEVVAALERPAAQWIRDCGHVPDHMDPTNRILWWNEQSPATMAQARWFLGWHEQVSLHLIGYPTIDPALASGFGIFDLATNSWSAERVTALGIDPHILPEVARWATPLGRIRPKAAAELDLPPTCMFVTGSWDGSCAAVGAGVVDDGSVLVAAGTWESAVAPLSRPRLQQVAVRRLALTPQPSTPGRALWARSPNGTSVLDWALGVTGIRLAELEQALDSAGPDPSPALMVPHLSGAPGPWPQVDSTTGSVLGLTLATSGADLVRAALEGIAIELTLAVGALRAGGCPIRACTVAGGGARSPWWMQLKADLLGMPVHVARVREPGTLGAAMLAGVGAGVYGSVGEAAAQARIARRFEPDAGRASRYEGKLTKHRYWARALLPAGRER
jgi:sugar (pentulose or hexulose) kinase